MDPKSLKDQAMEAIEAAQKADAEGASGDNPAPTPPVVEPPKEPTKQSDDNQDGSNPPVPADDVPADNSGKKPDEQNREPKSSDTIVIDGQSYTPEDIKKFREDSINKENWQKSLTQQAQEFSEIKGTMDKMKELFSEKKENNQPLTPEEEKFRKETDAFFADPFVQQKIQEQVESKFKQKVEEEGKSKAIEQMTSELKKLETEFNGEDGRPKYVDAEVLKWQKENNKLHLTPREAYELKYRDQLVEWEVQKRLKNKGGEAPKPNNSAPVTPKVEGDPKPLSGDRFERRGQLLDMMNSMNQGE